GGGWAKAPAWDLIRGGNRFSEQAHALRKSEFPYAGSTCGGGASAAAALAAAERDGDLSRRDISRNEISRWRSSSHTASCTHLRLCHSVRRPMVPSSGLSRSTWRSR